MKRLRLKSHSPIHDHGKHMQAQDTEKDLMSNWLLLSQNLKDLHQELSKQLTDSLTLSETQPRIIVIMHTHKKERFHNISSDEYIHREKAYQHLFRWAIIWLSGEITPDLPSIFLSPVLSPF